MVCGEEIWLFDLNINLDGGDLFIFVTDGGRFFTGEFRAFGPFDGDLSAGLIRENQSGTVRTTASPDQKMRPFHRIWDLGRIEHAGGVAV